MSEQDIQQQAEIYRTTHLLDGEYSHQTPLFTLGRVLYPSYLLFIVISTAIISLNQKKYRKRYKVDSVFFFVAIYIFNFIMTWYYFNSLHKFIRVAIPVGLMFLVSWFFNKFQIIGLTGGISSGKSTVSNFFKTRIRMSIIDCDVLARRVVEPGKPAYAKIVEYFGKQILLKDSKEIDRKLLGSIIFSNNSKRAWLTRTTGWYIFLEILKDVFHCCYTKNESMVILDAPLLFESKYLEYFCYPICCIYISDETIQAKRLMARDKISEEEAYKKIKSQMSIHKKMKKSDIIVPNDGTPEDLIKNVSKQLPNFVL